MLQPGVQRWGLGTAIHSKRVSGGALNRIQKLLHVVNSSPAQAKRESCLARILANQSAAHCKKAAEGAICSQLGKRAAAGCLL
jgi:hypothetical protein